MCQLYMGDIFRVNYHTSSVLFILNMRKGMLISSEMHSFQVINVFFLR